MKTLIRPGAKTLGLPLPAMQCPTWRGGLPRCAGACGVGISGTGRLGGGGGITLTSSLPQPVKFSG